jgi:hypothetical protein
MTENMDTGNGGENPAATEFKVQRDCVDRVSADRVRVRQSLVRSAEAAEIELRQGIIGVARGGDIEISQGATGLVLGSKVEISQGFARFVGSREVRLEQAGAMTVLANNVTVGPQSGVVFLLARTVDGDVRTLFDWRGALAFGAAFAVVASVLRLGRRHRGK